MAPSLVALFRQSLQRPDLSSFERDVLTRAAANGRIARSDYEEAHSRYAREPWPLRPTATPARSVPLCGLTLKP